LISLLLVVPAGNVFVTSNHCMTLMRTLLHLYGIQGNVGNAHKLHSTLHETAVP
jgi:hypothetical protein